MSHLTGIDAMCYGHDDSRDHRSVLREDLDCFSWLLGGTYDEHLFDAVLPACPPGLRGLNPVDPDPFLSTPLPIEASRVIETVANDDSTNIWNFSDSGVVLEATETNFTFEPFIPSCPSSEAEAPSPCDVESLLEISQKQDPGERQSSSEGIGQQNRTRQCARGRSTKPRRQDQSGRDGEAVLDQGMFLCSYPMCFDKVTKKQKRFRRLEHQKRHEKTVHERSETHRCWVAGCNREITRSDNLRSHLKKTHSKVSGRNRYVATLDENSEFYDLDWRGELSEDGFPIPS